MSVTVDDKTLLRKNILAHSNIWRLLTYQRSSPPALSLCKNSGGCSFYNFITGKYSERAFSRG